MRFTPEQIAALDAKLDAGNVKSRTQAGRALSYIEGWHAIAEANRIFGFDGWDRETVDLREVHAPYQNDKSNWVVGYSAKLRITVGGVVREGCGFGSGIDRDLGRAHESALKEAETDAMKRALMTFGNPFGLALYDKTQEGVERTPPPAQRRPAPPQEAPQADAAVQSMVEKIGMAMSLKALESTKKDAAFRADFLLLPPEQRTIVTDAITRAERGLHILASVPA